jgi:23S rRNA pseudouridine2605 synthase
VTETKKSPYSDNNNYTRLNKFISNAGVCARRAADELISAGLIYVNGEKVTTLGQRVCDSDIISYKGKVLCADEKVYVILNKPKDYITTLDDPKERKTVISLVKDACKERIYPVGRLDRHTTGVLLLTNDGELAKGLSHPSSNVKKVYHVVLNKELTDTDLASIKKGVTLTDGLAMVDDIHVNATDRKIVGIEIHMGRNRIVRRIFEHLGYEIEKLDRTLYAGLTKMKLQRGRWRHLNIFEIRELKKLVK